MRITKRKINNIIKQMVIEEAASKGQTIKLSKRELKSLMFENFSLNEAAIPSDASGAEKEGEAGKPGGGKYFKVGGGNYHYLYDPSNGSLEIVQYPNKPQYTRTNPFRVKKDSSFYKAILEKEYGIKPASEETQRAEPESDAPKENSKGIVAVSDLPFVKEYKKYEEKKDSEMANFAFKSGTVKLDAVNFVNSNYEDEIDESDHLLVAFTYQPIPAVGNFKFQVRYYVQLKWIGPSELKTDKAAIFGSKDNYYQFTDGISINLPREGQGYKFVEGAQQSIGNGITIKGDRAYTKAIMGFEKDKDLIDFGRGKIVKGAGINHIVSKGLNDNRSKINKILKDMGNLPGRNKYSETTAKKDSSNT